MESARSAPRLAIRPLRWPSWAVGLPLLPLAILVVVLVVSVFADVVAPHDPTKIDLARGRLPPAFVAGGQSGYLLGTDLLGRDVLSRTIKGAQTSLGIAAITIVVSGSFGTLLGMVAGLVRGWVDVVIMRAVDAFLAFPVILIALVFAITVGPGFLTVVFVISLFLWARYARLIRGETASIAEREFVALARVAGCSNLRVMLVHILPNVLNSVIVLSTLQVGYVIVVEATLSFLGAGVPPPAPTWGGMISEGRLLLRDSSWVSLVPGCALAIVVLSVNLFGDHLRDRLDPTLRQI